MDLSIVGTAARGPHDGAVPGVSGRAHSAGRNEFWFDPDDPLTSGSIFRHSRRNETC